MDRGALAAMYKVDELTKHCKASLLLASMIDECIARVGTYFFRLIDMHYI